MTDKYVSQLDTDGFFVGVVRADESPLDAPGVFLFPAGTIDVAPPPEVVPGFQYSFVAGEWVAKKQELDPSDPPRATAAQVWGAIKAERDRRKAAGVKVGAKWFHSDDSSRIQQIGLVMMGASIPPDLQWKTMDGSFVTMTQALAGQVFNAVATSDQVIFAVAEGHRVAMESSADPASYDYSTGWPAIYTDEEQI